MWLRDLAKNRAQATPERLAYRLLGPDVQPAAELTYAELDQRATRVASFLLERTGPGARVILAFESGLDFIVALYGCVYAGRVAVPVAVPRLRGASADRLKLVWQNAGAELVLTQASLLTRAVWQETGIAPAACAVLDRVLVEHAGVTVLDATPATELAFLQYTSGSTSDPKGVMVDYAALANNLAHIASRFGYSEHTRGVSWLPMHHDMGLIGSVFSPMHGGFPAYLMSPTDFVQRPARWLEAISRHGLEVSGGPTFGYAHCTQWITEEQRDGLDLSSWRLAFVGAEAVRAEVLDAFGEMFGPLGFRKASFYPCYGMAEATLMISGDREHHGPRVLSVDAEALGDRRVVPEPESARRLVACGEPLAEHRLRIVDPDTREACAPGQVGEIWVSGPSIAAGYWGSQQLTQETFRATLRGEEGHFLRTGDMGSLVDGRVLICTRLKTQIILRGRNLAPEDIEAAAQAVAPELVHHGGAAFAVEREAGESLVLVQEVKRASLRSVDLRALQGAVQEAIVRGFGVRAELMFVIQGAVPRTTSGKIRRFKARESYLNGGFARLASSTGRQVHHADASST